VTGSHALQFKWEPPAREQPSPRLAVIDSENPRLRINQILSTLHRAANSLSIFRRQAHQPQLAHIVKESRRVGTISRDLRQRVHLSAAQSGREAVAPERQGERVRPCIDQAPYRSGHGKRSNQV
jgi:hypothetical protein